MPGPMSLPGWVPRRKRSVDAVVDPVPPVPVVDVVDPTRPDVTRAEIIAELLSLRTRIDELLEMLGSMDD